LFCGCGIKLSAPQKNLFLQMITVTTFFGKMWRMIFAGSKGDGWGKVKKERKLWGQRK
jgi:hypothetical protein